MRFTSSRLAQIAKAEAVGIGGFYQRGAAAFGKNISRRAGFGIGASLYGLSGAGGYYHSRKRGRSIGHSALVGGAWTAGSLGMDMLFRRLV